MAKTITIEPLSRVEGHAKITIQIDDSNAVSDTQVNVTTLRGFERFCIGRPAEELPRIMTSICGLCAWQHHLAAAKANDIVFGVEPPPAAKKLREFCQSISYCSNKILYFYFLTGPDLIMGPGADPAKRNIFGILSENPEMGKKAVRARYLGTQMLNIVSGKSIHPMTAVPGGCSKPLTEADRDKALPMAEEVLEFAKFTMSNAKENIFSKYMDEMKTLGAIETGFLGTVTDDGALNLYDGKLRLMKPDGSSSDFDSSDYADRIKEKVLPWSYMKFPHATQWGDGFSIDPSDPKGIYRVGALARLNVCDKIATPLAQAELEEFRSQFGNPAQQTMAYNWAHLIELLFTAEHTVEMLKDPDITSREIQNVGKPQAARGVGCVEDPAGTLIHDYETDDNGIIRDLNIIVGTTQNNGAMNMSVKQAATSLIKDGALDQEIANKIEMMVRAYNPCFSCATH